MHWLVRVYTDPNYEEWVNLVVFASNESAAETKARRRVLDDNEEVFDASAEMFNSFEHGDINDYEIL